MALNIHTDPEFEKNLEWLSRHLQKTKTDVIKELVNEKFLLKRSGFRFGALQAEKAPPLKAASGTPKIKHKKRPSPPKYISIQKELKELDQDHDLD